MIKYEEEIEALLTLLDDSDNSVLEPVIERLIELGEPAIKKLEGSWEATMNPDFQERIETIIHRIQHGSVSKALKDWADCRGDNLLFGAYLIARSQYPDLEYTSLNKKLELIKSEIWLELNDKLTAMEKVKVINHFLFSVHKFNRSIRGVQTPQLYFINHVLDTHKGLPVSLAVIYAEIASRLELPVYCVDMPHNFLLCYHDPSYLDDPNGVMFYINPYTKGTILSRNELEFFLSEQNIEVDDRYLKPCSNIDTLYRLADGLRFAYSALRMEDKAQFLEQLMGILSASQSDHTP